VVIGIADPYRGEAAKAFIKLRQGAAALTLEGLRDFLKDKLGKHEVPAALELRDSLPRTAVGKLSRSTCARKSGRRRGSGDDARSRRIRGAGPQPKKAGRRAAKPAGLSAAPSPPAPAGRPRAGPYECGAGRSRSSSS
jgi:hypothetical protein